MNRHVAFDAGALRDVALEELTNQLHGPVLRPGNDGYDKERAGFNTVRSHRPQLIVGATGPSDIQRAVRYAGAHGLPVAVQGTGHAAGAVAAEGGVLITTNRIRDVRLDVASGSAWLGAGVRWSDVIHEAAAAGLAPLSGSAPEVGAVSYTLGGGLGLLSRSYGYAADHVRSLDVVTADARVRRVTATSDPDLFWALRGGRDNFGVVTGMEIGLFSVERIFGGTIVYETSAVSSAFETYVQWAADAPDELASSSLALISFPDVPALPEPLRGRRIAQIRVVFLGSADAGTALIAPLRAAGPRIADTVDDMTYVAAGSIYAEPTEPAATESGNITLGNLDSAAVRAMLDVAGPDAALPHVVELRQLGGALARPPAISNAVGNRDARFLLLAVSRLDRAGIADIRAAHRRLFVSLKPWHTGGRLLNFVSGEDAAGQVSSAFDPSSYRRLTELKARYDSDNTFRHNHNIPPHTGRRPGETT